MPAPYLQKVKKKIWICIYISGKREKNRQIQQNVTIDASG